MYVNMSKNKFDGRENIFVRCLQSFCSSARPVLSVCPGIGSLLGHSLGEDQSEPGHKTGSSTLEILVNSGAKN